MFEKIFLEILYDLTREKSIDTKDNSKWRVRVWVKVNKEDGCPLAGVAVRLYSTLLPTRWENQKEEKLVLCGNGDNEIGVVISQDDGVTEPISLRTDYCSWYWGGNDVLIIEAVAYNPPFYNERSFWGASLKSPDYLEYDKRYDKLKYGWEIFQWPGGKEYQIFLGPPKEPWKAFRLEKFEEVRNAKIEKVVREIEDHTTVKTLQSYNSLLTSLSEMRSAAEEIETDFRERAFAPFWDGICGFAVKMGRLEIYMRAIAQCYGEYKEIYGRYLEVSDVRDPQPSHFREEFLNPVDPKMLKQITDWFRATTRKGQTDFQFASIYEHYRTRDVLVEGFRDLVNKFNDISNALNSVNRSLISGFRELRECVEGLQEFIGDEFEYLRECIKEEEENTRQVIEEEGQTTRRVAIASEAASQILTQKRHEELLSSFEYQQEATRQALEDEFEDLQDSIREEGESDREFAEEIEDRRRERQRELLATYEYEQEEIRETLAVGLDRNEAGQQKRHEEVISEGKRDRKFLKDIDKQVGGEEWYKS